jgi:hypothetical protein
MSAATGWKLQFEALLVNKANLTRFSSNGFLLNGSATLLLPNDTPIENGKFAPNTLTIKLDAFTNFVVTLYRLMDYNL